MEIRKPFNSPINGRRRPKIYLAPVNVRIEYFLNFMIDIFENADKDYDLCDMITHYENIFEDVLDDNEEDPDARTSK